MQILGIPVPLTSAIADRSAIPKVGRRACQVLVKQRSHCIDCVISDNTTQRSNTKESAVSFLNSVHPLCSGLSTTSSLRGTCTWTTRMRSWGAANRSSSQLAGRGLYPSTGTRSDQAPDYPDPDLDPDFVGPADPDPGNPK